MRVIRYGKVLASKQRRFLLKWYPVVARAVKEVLLYVLIAVINPFGIVDWSNQHSQLLWQAIFAHSYPADAIDRPVARHDGPGGREAISVVYFDDAWIKRQPRGQPLDSFTLADTLDSLMPPVVAGVPQSSKPRAIFIDMVLDAAAPLSFHAPDDVVKAALSATQDCERRDPKAKLSPFVCLVAKAAALTHYTQWRDHAACQANALARLSCIAQSHGVPVIFADTMTSLERADRADMASMVATGSTSLDALGMVAMLAPATIDTAAYPLALPADPAGRYNHHFQLYPAALLYAAWCAKPNQCAPPPVIADDLGRADWSSQFDDPMHVIWGIGPRAGHSIDDPARLLVSTNGHECVPAEPGELNTLWHIAKLALGQPLVAPVPKPCLYPRAYPADILQFAGASLGDAARVSADRLVLIGGQFSNSNDIVPVVPFDAVPGVYLHAMALDNLIELGPHYARWPRSSWGRFTDVDLSTLVMVFLVAVVLGWVRCRLALPDEGHRHDAVSVPAKIEPMPLPRRLVAIAGGILLIFAGFVALTRRIALVPNRPNLISVTLFAVFGIVELLWIGVGRELVEGALLRGWAALDVLIFGKDGV